MQRRIAVTGMGIICSIGKNTRQFEESLKIGFCGIDRVQINSEPSDPIRIGAIIKNFSFDLDSIQQDTYPDELVQRIKRCVHRAPFVIKTSTAATLEAWQQSQLAYKVIASDRLGLVIAGNNLTQNYQYELFPKFYRNPEFLTPAYALHYLDSDHVGVLSEIFQIHGEGFTVGAASASGNVAIIKGCQLIQSGLLDACIVTGVLADLSPMELQGFSNLGAMGARHFYDAPKQACRPFDRDHEGFIYGQASGCLILEELASARKRDVPVLAEIMGGALVLSGSRLPEPSVETEARAMKLALNQANTCPDAVDYLNTHGTASPLGDKSEIEAIKDVFKNELSTLWLNSTKGLIGHCLYSAAVVECIATIIQMRSGFLHPNINLDNPIDRQCRFSPQSFMPASIETAMSNSFAFGGINTSLIIKRGD